MMQMSREFLAGYFDGLHVAIETVRRTIMPGMETVAADKYAELLVNELSQYVEDTKEKYNAARLVAGKPRGTA